MECYIIVWIIFGGTTVLALLLKMEKVLIPADKSEHSRYAFDWYLKELHKPGTVVYLVHSIRVPSMPTRDVFEATLEEGKREGNKIREELGAILAKLKINYVFIMDFERANLLITQTARKENVDLIVMGSGKNHVERFFLGSVSTYVLNNSACPVAICRKH